MALIPLNPTSAVPYGMFDGYDNLSLTGGEVVRLVGVTRGASNDKAAKDIDDGYTTSGSPLTAQRRPVVALATADNQGPLYLSDEGTTGYGTLFGVVVGGTAGQVVSGGTALGPATNVGSGKVTLWKSGLFGVTLGSLQGGSGGLSPTNTNLAVGATLNVTNAGLLTPVGGTGATGSVVLGRFLEFATSGSRVSTQSFDTLFGTGPAQTVFTYAVIEFTPPA